ncbi:tetratricopeptide repeat protein [Rhodanobacter ginsengiterrae]|uniref:tetratricopeptide repeat protein n=1 Tax=Rhodanobacter ginsengiterrae TaxID=2008451 RepID=UPI003CEA4CFF
MKSSQYHVSLYKLCALALVTLALWPALSGGFLFDDYPIFVENPAFHVNRWNWQAFHDVWLWSQANIQRPLAMLSYAVNYASGGSIWGFKAVNLAIHLLNTALLAALCARLLRVGWSSRDSDDAIAHHRRTGIWAWVLATAWALHPLQVSTVMYVVQRMELLGFTFTLLALLSYWRARQLQLSDRRSWPWLLVSVSLIAVGYFTKETVVLVPGYAFLVELTILHFGAARPKVKRNWQYLYAAGCVAAIAIFAFYLLPHYALGSEAFAGRPYTAWERELTQLRALSMYIGWSILPLPGQMHFYYDNYLVSTGWLTPATTLAGGLFLLGLLGLAAAMRLRRPLLALGIAWFFLAHLLTSAPLPLELVFEHRNYPALFGIMLALTDLLWLATRHAHPRLPAILATIFLVSFGFLTVLRAATWGNPLQLAMTLVHDNPTSPRASYDLARLYMDLSKGDPESPLFGRAISELERGAALPDSSPLPEQALLLTAAAQGAPPKDVWWESLLHKLQTRPLGPQEYRALQGLATRAVSGEAALDPRRLGEAYQIVLQRTPNSAAMHAQYAEVASAVMHDMPLAISQLELAISSSLADSGYPARLLKYLLTKHRLQEASAVVPYAEQATPGLHDKSDWRSLRQQLDELKRKP